MRTYHEIDNSFGYEASKAVLVRRCAAWARERDLPADEFLLDVAFDARHLSSDGNLALWRPSDIRRFLLEWIPAKVTARHDELLAAPETLRTLLRYLAHTGLRDPRGASVEENEAAIDQAARIYPDALADDSRWGVSKTMAMRALDAGVDVSDPAALARFATTHADRVPHDLTLRMLSGRPPLGSPAERTMAQLPVVLPPRDELAALAAQNTLVRQIRGLVQWAGPTGRALTQAGHLKLADARALAAELGTGEENLKVRTATELTRLNIVLEWAKKARLVRVVRGKLVAVAKTRPLLAEPLALWEKLFEAFFDLRDVACVPLFTGSRSIFWNLYPVEAADLLNTIYSMPHPMPLARLEEPVWKACTEEYAIDSAPEQHQKTWRSWVARDMRRMFTLLELLGAVEVTEGIADAMFSADLLDDPDLPGPPPLTGAAAAALLEQLSRPGELVALTALGTWAMRARLLAEGREAGLVGELVNAAPAELLGTIAEHYSPETGELEVRGWLRAHGEDLTPLLDAVRSCPFRVRALLMLRVLRISLPDGKALVESLRDDPVLAPLALSDLVEQGYLDPESLTPQETELVMTEQFLEMAESGGLEALREQMASTPGFDPVDVIEAMRASGHPAVAMLDEFLEELGPLTRRPAARAHRSSGGRPRPAGRPRGSSSGPRGRRR